MEGGRGGGLILVGLILLLFPMLLSRNPIFYWFRPWRTKGKAGGTDSKNAGDPYDLSAIYQEYKVRAAIGQEMANKDANRNGFVKPEAEGAYVLRSSKNILGHASAPTPIALDAPVLAALQQAAVDPEKLRQYAEDAALHPFLDTVLREAGVADLGTRLKAIEALQGAEDDGAGTGGAPRETVKPNQVTPVRSPANARVIKSVGDLLQLLYSIYPFNLPPRGRPRVHAYPWTAWSTRTVEQPTSPSSPHYIASSAPVHWASMVRGTPSARRLVSRRITSSRLDFQGGDRPMPGLLRRCPVAHGVAAARRPALPRGRG